MWGLECNLSIVPRETHKMYLKISVIHHHGLVEFYEAKAGRASSCGSNPKPSQYVSLSSLLLLICWCNNHIIIVVIVMQQSNCRSIDVITMTQQPHCRHHCHDVEHASPQPTRRLCNNHIVIVSSSSFGEPKPRTTRRWCNNQIILVSWLYNHIVIILIALHATIKLSLYCRRDCDATIKCCCWWLVLRREKTLIHF